MARPERFELPTYGFVEQGAILQRFENLNYICRINFLRETGYVWFRSVLHRFCESTMTLF